ncbi:hypothetical protein ID866_6777 [Astraeus odoratus]|nr:hypothetical protein ID866_6777 [Astraeus odoratus]
MSQLNNPRKRTTSFSGPALPRKASRMSLRRTESFLSLSDCSDEEPESFLHLSSASPSITPYSRPVVYSKEHRERHKQGTRSRPEFIIGGSSPSQNVPLRQSKKRCPQHAGQRSPPSPLNPSAVTTKSVVRKTSPLAPTRKLLPPRTSFPRSKPEPDLYRVAIKARMANSPEGEKILRMGPRLAVAILTATRELERIVSAAGCEEEDVVMADDFPMPPSTPTRCWRVVHDPRGQGIVHCGA